MKCSLLHFYSPLLYEKVRKCLEECQPQVSSRQIEDEIIFSGCFSVYEDYRAILHMHNFIAATITYFMVLIVMLTLLHQISQDLMLDAISKWDSSLEIIP